LGFLAAGLDARRLRLHREAHRDLSRHRRAVGRGRRALDIASSSCAPLAHYGKPSAARRRIYDESDRFLCIEWPPVAGLMPLARAIEPALERECRVEVEWTRQTLVDAMNQQLETPRVEVRVPERRPSNSAGELQGLHEPDEITGSRERITVRLRAAAKERVVDFRTFLRTLAHEVCHHTYC